MCRRYARISGGLFVIPDESVGGALEAATTFFEDLGWEGELPDLAVMFRLSHRPM